MQIVAFAPARSWSRDACFGTGNGPILIPLSPDRDHAAYEGGVVRGERDLYALVARSGQMLNVALRSAEDNAGLAIYTPEARLTRAGARPDCMGPTLTEAGEPETACWSGCLPTSGPYLIAVSPIRGNATYALDVSLS